MTSIGIVRHTDPLGRITLPIEMRRLLELSTGDHVEIFTEEDSIVLCKHQTKCALCDNPFNKGEETIYKDKSVCKNCIEQIKKNIDDFKE